MEVDVQLVVTEKLKNSLTAFGEEKILKSVKAMKNGLLTIHYSALVKLLTEFRPSEGHSKPFYLHELLVGSSTEIYEASPKVPEKSAELIKRLKGLQAEQDQRGYEEMVKNVSKQKKGLGEELGADVRSTSQQMVSVVNLLLTVFGCAFFAFFASKYAWENMGLRVIFAVVIGCVVALADLYFLARHEI